MREPVGNCVSHPFASARPARTEYLGERRLRVLVSPLSTAISAFLPEPPTPAFRRVSLMATFTPAIPLQRKQKPTWELPTITPSLERTRLQYRPTSGA